MADKIENIEEEQEDSKKEKTFYIKAKILKILKTVEKVVGIIVILFILLYTPFLIYGIMQKESKVIIQDEDIHKFPKMLKFSEKSVFKTKEFNMTLDIAPKDDKSVIVKTEIYLAYKKDHSDLGEELEDRKKELEDRIQLIISSKNLYDINSADKREYGLKKELINEINSLLEKGVIEDIYFTNFFFIEVKKL